MKHIFFDLDRTLWDFETNSEKALNILFDQLELGQTIRSFRTFHTQYKKINAELWYDYAKGKVTKEELRTSRFERTLKKFNIDDPNLALQLGDGYIELSPYQTNLFPHTIETLETLKKEDYALHIITNGFKEVQFIKLKNSGLIDYFDVILCSEEVGKTKPSPEVFQTALDRANAKKQESLMIGDDYHADILGAEKFGIQSILFDPENKHKEGSHDWKIKRLNEIPALIPWIVKSTL
ncbi:MAG: YjjG family noncanonical pyrimidine nucleotidase [Crocinitomicaceae bacterium]